MNLKPENIFDVRKSFKRAAKTYDRYAGFQRTIVDALLGTMGGYLKTADSALDIGCGTGYIHERLRDLGFKGAFFGMDLVLEMIRISRTKNIQGDSLGYLIQADAHDLPFGNHRFDLVISSLVTHWGEPEVFFSEMARVLKPNGRLYIALMGGNTYKELRSAIQSVLGITGNELSRSLPTFLDIGSITSNLKTLPWKHLSIRRETYEGSYEDLISFLKHLKGTGTQTNSLKAYAGLGGRGFIRRLEKEYPRLNGGRHDIPVTREVIFIEAVKGH